jgi:hypothetical protein
MTPCRNVRVQRDNRGANQQPERMPRLDDPSATAAATETKIHWQIGQYMMTYVRQRPVNQCVPPSR